VASGFVAGFVAGFVLVEGFAAGFVEGFEEVISMQWRPGVLVWTLRVTSYKRCMVLQESEFENSLSALFDVFLCGCGCVFGWLVGFMTGFAS